MRRLLPVAAVSFLLGTLVSPLVAAAPEVVLAPGESYTITVRAATAPPVAPSAAPIVTAAPEPSVAPTAAPTPVPTAAPTPAPTAAPTAPPTAAPTVPFGTRPNSPAIALNGAACQGIVIEGLTFRDLGANVNAIRLDNCANVTIRANDFINVAQGVTVYNSTGVRIEWNRYLNITGPYERVGLNRADFVQVVYSSGVTIADNKGIGGDTEDIISVHQSYGTAANPIVIERNHFQGCLTTSYPGCANALAWRSPSGSGIMLGDGGGAWQIARNNVLLNPGSAGIGVAGGSNITVSDNTVHGEARSLSNVGIMAVNYTPSQPCSAVTISGNQVRWRTPDNLPNGIYTNGTCGVTQSGNNYFAQLIAADQRVTL